MAKGIVFQTQPSNPVPPGEHGLWVDSSGDLIQKRGALPDINISAATASGGSAFSVSSPYVISDVFDGSLPKATPVSVDLVGTVSKTRPTSEASAFAAIGLTNAFTLDGASGTIVFKGLIKNITTSANFGDSLWVASLGGLTTTKPSIGVGGFASGDFSIYVGVVVKDDIIPAQKNLYVNMHVYGQL